MPVLNSTGEMISRCPCRSAGFTDASDEAGAVKVDISPPVGLGGASHRSMRNLVRAFL